MEISKPRAQFSVIALEEALILAELAISVGALKTHAWGSKANTAASASIIFWTYLLVLSTGRFLFTYRKESTCPNLWYHTSWLYGIQWILSALLFRSSIIHPLASLSRRLQIANFCISTVLALIALFSRKGNRNVLLEHEGDLAPSREPLANAFSICTFSWVDPIVLLGYKKTLELPDIWNLTANDKSAAVLADFRQLRKTSKLAWHLLKYFRTLLLVQSAWAVLSGVLTFAPTLLLKAFLEYVEDPAGVPLSAAWFYIILLGLTTCAQAITDGQALWTGRKICIRLRAVIVGEVYGKALRRKAAAGGDTVLGDTDRKKSEAQAKKHGNGAIRPSLGNRYISMAQNAINDRKAAARNGAPTSPGGGRSRTKTSQPKTSDSANTQANVGTIINLMAVDSFKVSDISAYLHFVWGSTPVQLIFCIVLLYRILGWSAIASIIMMVLVMPLNMFIAKQFQKMQKKVMAGTDVRINATNEILQNIRIIKYFAWEQHFGRIVDDKRKTELQALRNKYILWSIAATIWFSVPVLITFLSFLLYTVVEKRPLIPSVAFSALSLFGILRYPLDQLADMIAHVQEAKVSVDRVEEFLNEEETEKYDQLDDISHTGSGEPTIALEKALVSWGSKELEERSPGSTFRLIDMNVRFRIGTLNIIAGPTGSGKTSLLMALLGEMTLLQGSIHLPGVMSREDLTQDSTTGLTNSVAYCAQQAWLVNDTIKENIIFASTYNEDRYRSILNVCALERDLQILENGDRTLVGEKGISLSGGQKQRICLARAIYSSAQHVLLDDCLSAVDSHTAKHIFEHCIMGPLMFGRTCILVTHNVLLCVPRSHYVVALNNGKVTAQGSPQEVVASGALGDEIARSRPASRGVSQTHSRALSSADINAHNVNPARQQNGHASAGAKDLSNVGQKESQANIRTETKATGSVNVRVIALYLTSMGPWYYWIVALLFFVFQQVVSVAANVWIRTWSNAYTNKVVMLTTYSSSSKAHQVPSIAKAPQSFSVTGVFWSVPIRRHTSLTSKVQSFSEGVDDWHYLAIYAIIGGIYVLISLGREGYIFWGSLRASQELHARLLQTVTRAKIQFFDTTPLGQLMNRFSKDIEAIDQDVSPTAVGVLGCLASLISIIVLISVITPGFLIAGFFISLIYFAIGSFYIRSSRDLKRLDSVNRSPIYQHFGETLNGVVTIRAYCDERRFIRDNQLKVDTQNRPFYYLWATNRWLALRVDFTGALVSFFAGVFIILQIKTIDAGSAGLSLTYAVMFTENVLWLVRLYASNEQNMNSVERVKEYIEVEQEAKAIIEDNRPPSNWPSKGAIEFVKYSTRYRPDLESVLKDLTFNIQPGERVGIVGRTGAGKSSLALALFRGLEAQAGTIVIDGIDIGSIGLQDLRQAITIVPQDPTLFTGTIRSNLDPFSLYTDEDIFTVLRRVQLIGSPPSAPPSTSTATTAIFRPQRSPVGQSLTSASPLIDIHDEENESGEESSDDSSTSLLKIATNSRLANTNPFLNLSHKITESGGNLSQGQRQLLCLARALLKHPRVLIMDEATASIDYATDSKIQDTLRQVRDSTIITIAHRLQTIADYDKVIVLEKGEMAEFGPPWELVGIEGGIFRGMCESSGDGDGVVEIALAAGRKKKEEEEGRAQEEDSHA